MVGLIFKDLMIIKYKIFKPKVLFTVLAFIIFSLTILHESFLVISTLLVFLLINNISHTFINEEESGWLKFLITTTDVAFSKMVISRYLTYLFLSLFSVAIFSIFFGIYNLIYKLYPINQFVIIIVVILIASLVYIILSTPFLYMFLQNGFIVMMISIIFTILILNYLNILNPSTIYQMFNLNTFSLIFYTAISLFISFILSYWLSIGILKNKATEEI